MMPKDSFRRCICSAERGKQSVTIYFSHFLVLTERKSQFAAGLEVTGQLVGVGSFSYVGSGDGTLAVRLGVVYLYPLSLQGTRLSEDRMTPGLLPMYVSTYAFVFIRWGCAIQADLELFISLLQLLEIQDYGCIPPYPAISLL